MVQYKHLKSGQNTHGVQVMHSADIAEFESNFIKCNVFFM